MRISRKKPQFGLLIVCALITIFTEVRADDSLQSLYKENLQAIKTTDTARIIKSYFFLGDYLGDLGEYEKSNSYLFNALEFAEKTRNHRRCGTIYNTLAANASYVGNRLLAFSYYHKALKYYADIKDLDKVAMVLANMGSEYEYAGEYDKAIAYKLKALQNKEASGNTKNLESYYQNLGQLFKETNTSKWKYYVEKAYEISKSNEYSNIKNKAAIFNDLGGIAKIEGNNKEAFAWYDSMLIISKNADFYSGMGTAYSNRSLLFLSEKKYQNAYDDITKAIEMSTKIGRKYGMIVNKVHAAKILLKMKRTAEAKKYAYDALEMAQELKFYPEEEIAAHLILARIGEMTQDWKLAYENYNAYKEGNDSIQKADVQKSMERLETQYRIAEKEKRIEKLNNENLLKTSRLERIKSSSIAVGIIALLTIVAFVFWNRKKQLTIQKQQAELKQKLLRVQMNPHFIFNTLNAINQYIQTNKSTLASDYLAQYAKLMRQILENSDVEYITLEDEIDFLKNYIELQQLRYKSAFAYIINVDPSIDTENIEIPPMLSQPFIENAIKHGVRGIEGGLIMIDFRWLDNKLQLSITDNGRGFQKNKENEKHKSFAITITNERLRIFGNCDDNILIQSPNPHTANGTIVSLNIPFKLYSI